MVLVFDTNSRGVLDFSLSSYIVILFVSLIISFITTALTSRDGPFGNKSSSGGQQASQVLNAIQAWDLLKSAVLEEASSIPHKSYLRPKAQEDKLYSSIKAFREAQLDDWSILWVNGHIEQRVQERTTDLMQILSRRLRADHHLAATFSCANPSNWDAEKHLIPTLAYQLADSRPGTRAHISAALVAHPMLLNQSPRVQFDQLITTPMVKDFLLGKIVPAIPRSTPKQLPDQSIFILDAFHKCGSNQFQTEILHAISRLTSMYEGPPLTFIIGSSVTQTISVNFFAHHHLAIRTKPLIIDSSADDATILAGASMNPIPLLLRQAYSPVGQDHFYTIDSDEFARAQHIAYRPLLPTYNPYRLSLYNAIGGAYPTFVSNSIPLFRLFNIGTGDHHYATDLREIGDAVRVGYELECIAGFVLQKHGEPEVVNVTMGVGVGNEIVKFEGEMMRKPWELRRMWSGGKRDHVYLTLDSDKEKERFLQEGYVDEGVIGRVVPLF